MGNKSGELRENRMSLELQEAVSTLQPGQVLKWSIETDTAEQTQEREAPAPEPVADQQNETA